MRGHRIIKKSFIICGVFFLAANSQWCLGDNKVVVIPLHKSSSLASGIDTVTSAGQVWMTRNLGALRPATRKNDSESYGYLYQWGRAGDGHEQRTSPETSINSDYPDNGRFITENVSPRDWRINPDDTLWQGEAGTNNPCPAGFRIPTIAELEIERSSWSSINSNGAFNSPLRLTVGGYRRNDNGFITYVGTGGRYWSSTVSGSEVYILSFNFGTSFTTIDYPRAYGCSVRCIKD